ncbi:hypothetical protein BDU57DRAFT_91291 [Ampelomyces quisqualis]|uniref:Uncharacterized protein n=1 Tax=Ampelomyces quisqualis TaxID=50730 RepID=A0A6A5QAQ3_AMPQU|nr:hypothetical protein BDU57DRAFT_91291 [Ampelomyces quisqualis]
MPRASLRDPRSSRHREHGRHVFMHAEPHSCHSIILCSHESTWDHHGSGMMSTWALCLVAAQLRHCARQSYVLSRQPFIGPLATATKLFLLRLFLTRLICLPCLFSIISVVLPVTCACTLSHNTRVPVLADYFFHPSNNEVEIPLAMARLTLLSTTDHVQRSMFLFGRFGSSNEGRCSLSEAAVA